VPDSAASDHFICTPEALHSFLNAIPNGDGVRVAIDTEADSLHSYREKLCLIQMGVGDRKVLIDPLGIADLSPLLSYLDSSEIWLHGADLDMSLMRRTYGHIPVRMFDTQVAARLCGERQFGLAHLVESNFGVALSKQSQRADWGRRPLTDRMIEYALNDVHFIIPLADKFLAKLRELGREEWFRQSCEDARLSVLRRPPPDPDELWRLTGSGKLRPAGLNFLRALWRWRDSEAERLDRPTFKVIGNQDLLNFAEALQEGAEVRLPDRYPPPFHRRFYRALKEAREVPEADWPKRPARRRHERNPEAEKRFDALKELRDRKGAELDLDPALLGSRAVLEAIADNEERAPELLLPWQLAVLGLH
jgi:ribonuclease D